MCVINAGLSLYGVSSRIGIDFPLMDALLFGTLIAAVDPVAVSCYIMSSVCNLRYLSWGELLYTVYGTCELLTKVRLWRRPRPHVFVFVWKLFFTDTAIVYLYTMKMVTKNATFRKRSPEWIFFKNDTVASSCQWFPENGTFRFITMTSHYWFEFSCNFCFQIQNGGHTLHSVVFRAWAYLKRYCVLSTKFVTPINYSCWLSKKARRHHKTACTTSFKMKAVKTTR